MLEGGDEVNQCRPDLLVISDSDEGSEIADGPPSASDVRVVGTSRGGGRINNEVVLPQSSIRATASIHPANPYQEESFAFLGYNCRIPVLEPMPLASYPPPSSSEDGFNSIGTSNS